MIGFEVWRKKVGYMSWVRYVDLRTGYIYGNGPYGKLVLSAYPDREALRQNGFTLEYPASMTYPEGV